MDYAYLIIPLPHRRFLFQYVVQALFVELLLFLYPGETLLEMLVETVLDDRVFREGRMRFRIFMNIAKAPFRELGENWLQVLCHCSVRHTQV